MSFNRHLHELLVVGFIMSAGVVMFLTCLLLFVKSVS